MIHYSNLFSFTTLVITKRPKDRMSNWVKLKRDFNIEQLILLYSGQKFDLSFRKCDSTVSFTRFTDFLNMHFSKSVSRRCQILFLNFFLTFIFQSAAVPLSANEISSTLNMKAIIGKVLICNPQLLVLITLTL